MPPKKPTPVAPGPHPTIATTTEAELVSRLRRQAGSPPAWVTVGIGDDAAIIEPGRGQLDVVTTDSLIEGVHFRRGWVSPTDLGYKALAVNLSDLAAMGATPRASLLSLGLPGALPLAEFDQLVAGFIDLANSAGAPLVGGNLARSPGPLMLDVTALGVGHRRKLMQRSLGRAGDELYVTGTLGAAAAGLGMLAADLTDEADHASLSDAERDCIHRHVRPSPRWRLGSSVARSRASVACIDLSDGLADAAAQLAAASGTGVVIDGDRVPVHAGAAEWATRRSLDAAELALSGGEDYELLFAVHPRKRRRFLATAARYRNVEVTRVGRLIEQAGSWIERGGSRHPLPTGFGHFGQNQG